MKKIILSLTAIILAVSTFAQNSKDSPINVHQLLKDKEKYSEKEVFVIGRYESNSYRWNEFSLSFNDYVIEITLKNEDLGAQRRFEKLGLQDGYMIIVKGVLLLPDGWLRGYPELIKGEIIEIDFSPKPQGEFEVNINLDNREVVDKPGSLSYLPESRSNAHLVGRKVDGDLVKPYSQGDKSGVVVVTIYVDIHGNVQKAIPGASGTTINDANLLNEARSAAMKTHFTKITNVSADTSQLQEGTITYIFKLK